MAQKDEQCEATTASMHETMLTTRAEKDKVIAEKDDALRGKAKTIAELELERDGINESLAEKEKEVAEKTTMVAELRRRLSSSRRSGD